jgi:hypothetical protein
MNITLLETNKKKLKVLRNRLQLLGSNFNDEIRILMDQRERLDKTSMSIDGNNLHIEELDHLRHRIQFLQSQQAGLQEILVSI